MYIPVQRGLIIDCITDKSKHHLLYKNFITVVKFINKISISSYF